MTEAQERVAARIDALEIRFAHQDDVIESLNKTVIQQWARIDEALARIKLLEEKLREVQVGVVRDAADEAPPPHY